MEGRSYNLHLNYDLCSEPFDSLTMEPIKKKIVKVLRRRETAPKFTDLNNNNSRTKVSGKAIKLVCLKHSRYQSVAEFLLITTTNVYLPVYQGRERSGRWRGVNIYSQHRMLYFPVG